MSDPATCWARYMSLMEASRQVRLRRVRATLIREAYGWLDAFFESVEREVGRNSRSAGR